MNEYITVPQFQHVVGSMADLQSLYYNDYETIHSPQLLNLKAKAGMFGAFIFAKMHSHSSSKSHSSSSQHSGSSGKDCFMDCKKKKDDKKKEDPFSKED